MKVSEIRALDQGAPLLTRDGARVVYVSAEYGPSLTRTRQTYAVVQHGNGARSWELPRNLSPASPVESSPSGHVIRVERLTEGVCRTVGLPLAAAGTRAVVERGASGFVKVCEIDGEQLPGTPLEAIAESLARTYKARYIPAGG